MKLGEKLTILDRTIQFTPNKYFVPIEKMIEQQKLATEMVRTDSQQREIGPKNELVLSWLSVVMEVRTIINLTNTTVTY